MPEVKHSGKTYELRGGEAWTKARFEYLKKEAKNYAKVAVIDPVNRELHLIPLNELDWVDFE